MLKRETLEGLTPILAIVAIAGLEAFAIARGIDGVLLAGTIAVISGLGGYEAKRVKDRLQNKRPQGGDDG